MIGEPGASGGITSNRNDTGEGSFRGGEDGVFPLAPQSFTSPNTQDAEDRLLRGTSARPSNHQHKRFLTLHRRRRKKPPTRSLNTHRALLDDLYHGPTKCVLSKINDWDFNAFALDSVCGGRPVSVLCVFLLHKYGLINQFKMDTVAVWKCFSLIEDGYHASNPYHNAVHAADVTQAMHCYLQEDQIKEHTTPMELLAALVAAVCHDLDHPGVNQPFLIATDNHLAILYKNLSVLENHHWRCAMGCLWESGLIDDWKPEDVAELQETIRSLILATDITRQQEFLKRFQTYQETKTLDMKSAECRHFSLQIALKCADICNPCRPWDISHQWSQKICDEFYRQGDYERQLNLPLTPLCDRHGSSVAKIQSGFIRFVVSPLFESWNIWLETKLSNNMIKNMNDNLLSWEQRLKNDTEKQATVEVDKEDCQRVAAPLSHKTSTSSNTSDGSQGSVLGSLESVSQSLLLGRRHSLPLSVPGMLPRTVIRRESVPEAGQPPLVLETVVLGDAHVGSTISTTTLTNSHSTNLNLTSECLLPDPSITTMGGVGRNRKQHTKISRRASLPPLWPNSRHRSTPSSFQIGGIPPVCDELPIPCKDEVEERIGRIERSCGSGESQQTSSQQEQSCSTTHEVNNSNAVAERLSGTKLSQLPSDTTNTYGCCININETSETLANTRGWAAGRTSFFSQSVDNTEPMSRRSRCGRALVRRASLDSKKEFLHRVTDPNRPERTQRDTNANANAKSYRLSDKENRIPIREKHPPLWKTRQWRSLNHDDEGPMDNLNMNIKAGLFKLNSPCNEILQNRRGSAPLLRPEDLGNLTAAGCEKSIDGHYLTERVPDIQYLNQRRSSAPTYHLFHDQENLDNASFSRTALDMQETCSISVPGKFRNLNVRRSSMPSDLLNLHEKFGDRSLQQTASSLTCNSNYRRSLTAGESHPTYRTNGSGLGGVSGSMGALNSLAIMMDKRDYGHNNDIFSGLFRFPESTSSASGWFNEFDKLSSGTNTPATPNPDLIQPSRSHTHHMIDHRVNYSPSPSPRRGSLPADFLPMCRTDIWQHDDIS